jgi:hypothetical protein
MPPVVGKHSHPSQLLFKLAQDEGPDVVHLPYSREFEAVCHQINPSATTQDKHTMWEQLLELRTAQDPASKPPTPMLRTPQDAPPSSSTAPTPRPVLAFTPPPPATGLLFPTDPPTPEVQSWSTPREAALSPDQAARRQKMLADIANSYLATREQRVAHILQRFPETRDSDTALCIRYWKLYQPDVLERWDPLELEVLYELDRIETLGRVRRMIQNDLRLFRGIEDTRRAREAIQAEFHEYVAAHRDTLPEVRFYLDETGNEGGKTYTGIAGVCIINWKQYEKHHAVLEQWRAKQGPETIHFSEMTEDKVERAVSLLQLLQKRRGGLLFLGYSLLSRGQTHEDLFSLFIQLIIDSLNHLRDIGCLSENRSVRVIKEADTGFDNLFLDKMTKRLGEAVALEFPGQLTVLPVEAVTKGRSVLLECADLIAGGMQRRALGKGRNPKDRFAEAVINVTGFEDKPDTGTLFKYFAPGR